MIQPQEEEGWKEWTCEAPPFGALIQVRSRGWGNTTILKREDLGLRPESNVYGLYWKLTGIGKMYLESIRPETYAPLNFNSGSYPFLSGFLRGMGTMGAYPFEASPIEGFR